MRTPSISTLGAEDDDWTHQALLAHATDLTVIGTALLPVEGLSQADTGTRFHSAVTSQTLWFHESFRMDDWVLVDQHSPVLAGSRAFGRGDVWTHDGRLRHPAYLGLHRFRKERMIAIPLPRSIERREKDTRLLDLCQ